MSDHRYLLKRGWTQQPPSTIWYDPLDGKECWFSDAVQVQLRRDAKRFDVVMVENSRLKVALTKARAAIKKGSK